MRSFSYDSAGNVTADTRGSTTYNYAYNKRNRLAELTIGSTVTADYTYDGLERPAIRTTSNMTPAGTTQYVYDLAGHLIAEADSSGNTLTEYIWLEDMPIAVVANVDTSPTVYFVHPDHLNRPIRMTDGSESVVWDSVYNPFGDVYSITGLATNNMRFPGQYFLIEDGLSYNWYRHYDPTLGRYLQPDPLGNVLATQPLPAVELPNPSRMSRLPSVETVLSVRMAIGSEPSQNQELGDFADGSSIYSYAHSAPMTHIDKKGLVSGNFTPFPKVPGAMICASQHDRCVDQCLHLLPSPSGDLQSSEYRKCYRECMGRL